MNARSDRLFALCGIAFVALQLGGTFLAMATGKTHDLTIGSSTPSISRAIAHPAGAGVWAGAYMEMLSVCFFLAFAVWAAERLGAACWARSPSSRPPRLPAAASSPSPSSTSSPTEPAAA